MTYEIHYGLANTLNTGKPLTKKSIVKKKSEKKNEKATSAEPQRFSGQVKFVDKAKGFGFIKHAGIPFDIYFKISESATTSSLKKNDNVSFEMTKDVRNNGKVQAKDVKRL